MNHITYQELVERFGAVTAAAMLDVIEENAFAMAKHSDADPEARLADAFAQMETANDFSPCLKTKE